MKKITRFVSILLALVMVIAMGACSNKKTTEAPAAKPGEAAPEKWGDGSIYQIACSSSGGSLYALGVAWANLIEQSNTADQFEAVSTGGGTENVRLLASGEVQMACGMGPEVQDLVAKSNGSDGYDALRGVWGYLYGGPQFIVLESSGIKTIEDMRGKRISVGAPGSSGATYATQILALHGLKEGDYTKETLTGTNATQAMKDGDLDVFVFCASVPVSYATDLATTNPIRLIGLDPQIMEEYCKQYPSFILSTFPKDAYPNQCNEEDVVGVYWVQFWMARADVPEEVVYQSTKALFDNIDDFYLAHDSIKVLTLENALNGLAIPIHPGAKKYYQEKGIAVPNS